MSRGLALTGMYFIDLYLGSETVPGGRTPPLCGGGGGEGEWLGAVVGEGGALW